MASSAMHVVVATDDAFALPTAVTLRSLVSADEGIEYHLVVLHRGLSAHNRQRISESLPANGSNLEWLTVEGEALRNLPNQHLSIAAYYRLLIPELLPEIERVLYADSDVLFRHAPAPLWELELGNNRIAAVRSVNYPSFATWGALDHWRQLGLSPRASYFNSGVMVIDVEAWKKHSVQARVVEFVDSPLANGTLFDQQALNVVLAEHWLELPPTWNAQTPFFDDQHGAHLLYDDETVDQTRRDPAVVHFSDRPKPWHRDCNHPFRDAWRQVAGETAFAPFELERTTLLTTMKARVKRSAAVLLGR